MSKTRALESERCAGSAAGLTQQRQHQPSQSRGLFALKEVSTITATTADTDTDPVFGEEITQAGVTFDWARVRNGDVRELGHIEIPENYFEAATSAVIEQLTVSRNKMRRELPSKWSEHVVRLLVDSKLIARADAQHAEAVISNAMHRALEEAYVDAKQRVQRRFPIALRTLIPLITVRRTGK